MGKSSASVLHQLLVTTESHCLSLISVGGSSVGAQLDTAEIHSFLRAVTSIVSQLLLHKTTNSRRSLHSSFPCVKRQDLAKKLKT